MNEQNIVSLKKEILINLSKRQLKNAVEKLTKLAVNLQNWQVSEKLSELETNYKYMLHYQFQVADDPTRREVYTGFLRTLFEMTDDVVDELLLESSSGFFYEKARIGSLKPKLSVADYQSRLKEISESAALVDLLEEGAQKVSQVRDLSVRRERVGSEMFIDVYTAGRASQANYADYNQFLQSTFVQEREKCLLVSALTLSLMHRFDAYKVRVLMDQALNENPMIGQRAIVGLIVVLQMYDVRWQYYDDCRRQLETLSENPHFKKSVLTVIKQLIRSRETEKISRIMTEEIIPEMLKFNTKAGKKLNMEDLMGESDFAEKNPEWKKEIEESGLANKLQEYSNLQMEGADVFHSTFASLKSFPFFSELGNWFLPFDTSYSELQGLFSRTDENSFVEAAIVNSGHMCDSDKYSFAFSLMQLPESQREMMLRRFGEESEEMKQLQKELAAMKSNSKEEIISNQYIQDLYRFFKLFAQRNSFFDIFRLRINFYDKKSIAPLISGSEDMKQIALYCFEKNFFREALSVFELLTERENAVPDIWQKIGYCRQMLKDLNGALDAYLQADLLMPDNSWTMRRIAQLYRTLKQPERALEFYLRLQSLAPENISNELNVGHCYLDMGENEKALNVYFKVELMDGGDNPKAWRPIAWTAFLLGRFDLSRQYYRKILSDKPTEHDYLNAGHVELVLNNKKDALEFYTRTRALLDNDAEEFISLFEADRGILLDAGVDESFLPLLFDEIRYKFD